MEIKFNCKFTFCCLALNFPIIIHPNKQTSVVNNKPFGNQEESVEYNNNYIIINRNKNSTLNNILDD